MDLNNNQCSNETVKSLIKYTAYERCTRSFSHTQLSRSLSILGRLLYLIHNAETFSHLCLLSFLLSRSGSLLASLLFFATPPDWLDFR